ncbi:MAG: HNH endonuclease [SAR324 cluster bacterium]|nr:HNH endonuclease [SAR324 cluster bacterium]
MGLDQRYHRDWVAISRYIRELFQHHCARCGRDCSLPVSSSEALQVHHIDENPQNNDLENLIPVCARCHLQIEKEARIHAPWHQHQQEMFDETYLKRMKAMRQSALTHSIHNQESKFPATDDFELREMDFQPDDFDY